MCACVRVCMFPGSLVHAPRFWEIRVCVRVYLCMYVCMYVCMVCMYGVIVCVCVCVCVGLDLIYLMHEELAGVRVTERDGMVARQRPDRPTFNSLWSIQTIDDKVSAVRHVGFVYGNGFAQGCVLYVL